MFTASIVVKLNWHEVVLGQLIEYALNEAELWFKLTVVFELAAEAVHAEQKMNPRCPFNVTVRVAEFQTSAVFTAGYAAFWPLEYTLATLTFRYEWVSPKSIAFHELAELVSLYVTV